MTGLRVATQADSPQIAALMQTSVLELFPKYYDTAQTASAAVHIAALDPLLVDDGTFFVYDAGGEVVACGGWSRRAKLFSGRGARNDDKRLLNPASEAARVRAMFVRSDWTRRGLGRTLLQASAAAAKAEGFSTLALMATLPGVPLYRAFGFRERERVMITMPDGVRVDGVLMDRPVDG